MRRISIWHLIVGLAPLFLLPVFMGALESAALEDMWGRVVVWGIFLVWLIAFLRLMLTYEQGARVATKEQATAEGVVEYRRFPTRADYSPEASFQTRLKELLYPKVYTHVYQDDDEGLVLTGLVDSPLFQGFVLRFFEEREESTYFIRDLRGSLVRGGLATSFNSFHLVVCGDLSGLQKFRRQFRASTLNLHTINFHGVQLVDLARREVITSLGKLAPVHFANGRNVWELVADAAKGNPGRRNEVS